MDSSVAVASRESERNRPKIAIFGHFGAGNFGNESTLQAILHHLRLLVPNAEVTCICTSPETVAAAYHIAAVPISGVVVKPRTLRNPLARLARKLFIGIPREMYRWLSGLNTLRGTRALIIPGTGLLTDAYGLRNWGPYSVFKWVVIAKLCRAKVFFVSVGAGPLYSRAGRRLVKAALSLADFRSYRDESTLQHVKAIGFRANKDRVSPDLVFSLPEPVIPRYTADAGRRPVVGLGLMNETGRYSNKRPTGAIYAAYLETLAEFVSWLLAREYDVRLLIGAGEDILVTQEFRSLLRSRPVRIDETRIVDKPATSVESLLLQLATTDMVVATRFHNVLLALLLNKPAISISFHHKCASLMSQMGLPEYCQDMNDLKTERLIEQFCRLEKNAGSLRPMIRQKAEGCRKALDEQYSLIFKDLEPR